MRLLTSLAILLVVAALAGAAAVWLGVYNVAADDPHWRATYRLLELARERSVAARAAGIEVPPLDDAALIRSGAGNYAAMCVTCHLSPDAQETELSVGLSPRPPRWDALGQVDPREAFWVLKHGIKGSGMPAWGKSMEDRYLWGMVAFLRQFPTMTAAQYGAQVGASPGHSHGGGETDLGSGEPEGAEVDEAIPAAAHEHDESDPHHEH
jgi:mono/diheme cytochrome c family protein